MPWTSLLPHTATPKNEGSLEPFMRIVLAMLGVLDLLHGCVHWLAPESGAGSIAGMDLSTSSAPNIVYLLAAAGISQACLGSRLPVRRSSRAPFSGRDIPSRSTEERGTFVYRICDQTTGRPNTRPLSAYDNVRDCRRNCLAVASANFGVVAGVSINRNHLRR